MELPFLPVIDYGGIALVVSRISALGGTIQENERYGFDVFLSGHADPVFVAFDSEVDAEEARDELLGAVARYYYIHELGLDDEDIPGPGDDWKEHH